jgi:aprataxin
MSTQTIFYVDDQVVGMVDGYPKAKHHYLFVARTPGLNKASELSRQHLALLAHMKAVACHCASLASKDQLLGTGRLVPPLLQQQQQQQCSVPEGWMLGFHSVPSMAQLHLHALTTDLCSPCVKHKKHWNSFTTAFFLPIDAVMDQLERHGSVAVDVGAAEALLKGPLVCQVCGQVLGTMPALKQHVQAHFP